MAAMKRAAPVPPSVATRSLPSDRDGWHETDSISTMDQSSRKSSSSIDGTVTLSVILPDGQSQPFNVNRRMPLMDLLVHAASIHHFNPSEYSVYNPSAKFANSSLPNTPVGELATDVIQIVPKNSAVLGSLKRSAAAVKADAVRSTTEQPLTFEKTFRLQINLPHHQKMMLRVSPNQALHEILTDICTERNLDSRGFTLRNPRHLDRPLDLYRALGDEQTKEINLVPSAQGTIAQSNRKSEPFAEVHPLPKSPVQEKGGLNIFRICRKKRSPVKDHSNNTTLQPKIAPETAIRPMNPPLNKSLNTLTGPPPAVDTTIVPAKPVRNNKKAAPLPPPVDGPTADPLPGPLTDSEGPKVERTRHHSESSGYDESLAQSNSPERDGAGSAGRMSSAVVPGDLPGKTAVSTRSATSTPDSGLKSASDGVIRTTVPVSKKKAPAPPAPLVTTTVTSPLEILPRNSVSVDEITVEVRSRAASSTSAASTSDKISIGSFGDSQSSPSTRSSVSIKQSRQQTPDEISASSIIRPASTQPPPNQNQLAAPARFIFDSGSCHSSDSVAEQTFDSESSVASLDVEIQDSSGKRSRHESISVNVDVHVQKAGKDDDPVPTDWDYPTPEEISDLKKFSPSGLNGPDVTSLEQSGTDRDSRPSTPTTELEMKRAAKPREVRPNITTPPAFKNLFSNTNPAGNQRLSSASRTSPGPSSPDSVKMKEKKADVKTAVSPLSIAVRNNDDNTDTPSPSPLKFAFPDRGTKGGSALPSPSPSSASLSSLKAPAFPVSMAPPPISAKPPSVAHAPIGRRVSPAHVSISALADAKNPERYRQIAINQPLTPYTPSDSPLDLPLSRQELLKEIEIVQTAIITLQNDTQLVQQHVPITADELAAISDQQRRLQDHLQRQIFLTQQLLQFDEPTPKITTALELRAYGAPIRPMEPVKSFSADSKVTTVVAPPRPSFSGVAGEIAVKQDVLRQTRPKMQHRDSWIAESAATSRTFDFSKPPGRTASPVVESGQRMEPAPPVVSPAVKPPTSRPVVSPSFELPKSSTIRRVTPEPRVVVRWAEKPKIPPVATPVQPAEPPASQPQVNLARRDSVDQRVQISPIRGDPVRTYVSPTRLPDDIDIPRNVTVARQVSDGLARRASQTDSMTRFRRDSLLEKSEKPKMLVGNGAVSQGLGVAGGVSIRPVEPSSASKSSNSAGKPRPLSVIVRSSDPPVGSSIQGVEKKETPRESLVRSWKTGTPAPYHHVNSLPNVRTEGRRQAVGAGDGGGSSGPPPPPPPPFSGGMKINLSSSSVGMVNGGGGDAKRPVKGKEPAKSPTTPVDQRAQLCDAIRSFSTGSLRKVPAAAHKTWTPKIR